MSFNSNMKNYYCRQIEKWGLHNVNSLNKEFYFLHRCLTLDERRIDARKVCNSACVKAKSTDWKPSSSIMARDPGKLFFRNVVARILSNIVVKVRFKLIQYTLKKFVFNLFLCSTFQLL